MEAANPTPLPITGRIVNPDSAGAGSASGLHHSSLTEAPMIVARGSPMIAPATKPARVSPVRVVPKQTPTPGPEHPFQVMPQNAAPTIEVEATVSPKYLPNLRRLPRLFSRASIVDIGTSTIGPSEPTNS